MVCFSELLLALFRVRSINLSYLATAMDSGAEIASRYRRFQRFFSEVRFDYDALARFIMLMFDFGQQPYYLTLDRTNWKWGKKNLNLLVLAVVYKGAAVPVYWLVLNKQGNSNQRERIALMKRFIRQFGRQHIEGILGDREFIGKAWWKWLNQQNITFVMRMKANQHYQDKHGVERGVHSLFRSLARDQGRVLRKTRHVSGQPVYLSGLRLDSGELLILASNQKLSHPFKVYTLRWQIENLFQCLKGRGFDMETTRLTHYYRVKKMMAVLTIAFCWAHKTGEWRAKAVKPLKIKNHGRSEKSLFRYGLDYLADKLTGVVMTAKEALKLQFILLAPPDWISDNEVELA